MAQPNKLKRKKKKKRHTKGRSHDRNRGEVLVLQARNPRNYQELEEARKNSPIVPTEGLQPGQHLNSRLPVSRAAKQ